MINLLKSAIGHRPLNLCTTFIFLFFISFSLNSFADDSLSYTGRLVNTNGSPVTGPVDLKLELAYTVSASGIGSVICSTEMEDVPLSNGVFHLKINYLTSECVGNKSIVEVLASAPEGETVAIRVTDLTHSKAYSFHAMRPLPFASVANLSKTLAAPPNGTPAGYVLQWNGTSWVPAAGGSGSGSGSVTQVATGTGLSGGPITATGTISIANSGVDSAQIANSAITNAKVAAAAAIDRSKLATGTANTLLVNDASGIMSSVALLPLTMGGTGATSAADALTNLGIVIGVMPGNVLGASSLPFCAANEKLQWNPGPSYGWTCASDVDTSVDVTKLPLAGGTMTGNIVMGTNQITGLGTPSGASDAATKSYVDGLSHWTLSSGNIYRDTGRVGIGNALPDSILDISSTTSGLLIPRMSTGQRDLISPVPVGTQIYNTTTNELNYHNGTSWRALGVAGAGISSLTAGTGLSGGAITTSGTIGIAAGGVTANELAANAVTDEKVSATAAIARTKLANGTPNHVVMNDASGVLASAASLPLTLGGTGSTTASGARTSLELGTSAVANLGFVPGDALPAGNIASCIAGTTLNVTGLAPYQWTCTAQTIGSGEINDGTIQNVDISNTTITYTKLNLTDGDVPQAKVSGLVSDLAGKESSITSGTSAQYFRGDKTWQTLSTSVVPEGSNLYFLDSRVRSALLTGYTVGASSGIAGTDTLLQALGKLEGQIASESSKWTKSGTDLYYSGGNVGIGTTTPFSILEVRRDTGGATPSTSGSVDTHVGFRMRNTAVALDMGVMTNGNTWIQNRNFGDFSVNYPLLLNPNGGAVGIGTTSPGRILNVASTDTGTSMSSSGSSSIKVSNLSTAVNTWTGIHFNHGGTTTDDSKVQSGIFSQITNTTTNGVADLVFATKTSSADAGLGEKMRITSVGKVGIGTTTPSALMHVAASSTTESLKIPNAAESIAISASAATGTVNFYLASGAIQYYTANATANWTMDFAWSSGTSLNTAMAVGDSVTTVFIATQGATPYYPNAFKIDGVSVTPKWQGGTAPTAGNASSLDAYTCSLIKTANATYTVLCAATQYK